MDSEPDDGKKLAEGRAQRKALLLIWFVIGLVGMAILSYGHYQLTRARASAMWPLADGQIIVSRVDRHTDEEGTHYSANIKYRYQVGSSYFESDVVVIGGHNYTVHGVVARYPNGQAVKVAYNPTKPRQAVLEPGVESTQLQTLGVLMMSGAFFMAVLFNFILRQAMNEDKNAVDQVILLVLKTLFFPFKLSNGNPLIMGAMVGTAYCLSTLELHPIATWPARIFTALYGLGFIVMLWGTFMGWLMGLAKGDDDEEGCE